MKKITEYLKGLNIKKGDFIARALVLALLNVPLLIIRFSGYEGMEFLTKGVFQLLVKEPAMMTLWSYILADKIAFLRKPVALLEKGGYKLIELAKNLKTKLSK